MYVNDLEYRIEKENQNVIYQEVRYIPEYIAIYVFLQQYWSGDSVQVKEPALGTHHLPGHHLHIPAISPLTLRIKHSEIP